jgi:hypothetical protein
MTAVAEPLDQANSLILGQKLAGQPFLVMLQYNQLSAIQFVDGKDASPYTGTVLKQNQVSEIVITVRKDDVKVSVDGVQIIDWQGDAATLTPSTYWTHPTADTVMIGSFNCRYRFHRLSIEKLSDEVKVNEATETQQ